MEAVYTVTLPQPYTVNQLTWVLDSSKRISIDILKVDSNKNKRLVKLNKPFDLDDIKEERNRIDIGLKTKAIITLRRILLKAMLIPLSATTG